MNRTISNEWPWEFFHPHELASPDTGEAHMDPDFMDRLDNLRRQLGFPISVTSGFRTKSWNTQIGGSPKSAHMLGRAADIVIIPERRLRAFAIMHEIGFTGIGIAGTFIHIDDMEGVDRRRPYTWLYE